MEKTKNRRSIIAGAIAAAALLLAAACVFSITLFGDDYGYVRYTEGGAAAFFSRMAEHFKAVNGRTLVHAVDVLLLQGSGIPGKIAVLLTIPVLWLGAARLAGKGDKPGIESIAAAAVLFWLVGLPALRESVFWITGAMNYLLPTTLLVWQAALARSIRTTGKGTARFLILAIRTAATTEIAAAASLLVTLGTLAEVSIKPSASGAKMRRIAPLAAALLLSLAAAGTVSFAPGNALRASFYPDFYALPFFSRVAGHFAEVSAVCLSDTGILPALALLAAAAFARCVREKRYGLAAAAAVPALLAVLCDLGGLFAIETATVAALPVLAAGVALAVIFLSDAKRCAVPLALTLAAFGIQTAMLASPVFGPRTTFLSSTLLLIAALRIVTEDGFSLPLLVAAAAAMPVALPLGLPVSVPAVLAAALLAAALHFILRRKAAPLLALLLAAVVLGGGAAAARGYIRNGLVYRENDRRIDTYLAAPTGDLHLVPPPSGACRYTYFSDGSPWHDEQFRLWRGITREAVILWDGGDE